MMAEDKSIILINILVLPEVSVKLHMKVKEIVRATAGGWVILQQPSNNPAKKPKYFPLRLIRQQDLVEQQQQENPVLP
jgi:hypothetical protein